MAQETKIFNQFVPSEILCQIFSKYLDIQDISRFDVAICNHAKRKMFLECISSEGSVWVGDKEREIGSRAIFWLSSRKIKIRHLKCHEVFIEEKNRYGIFIEQYHEKNISMAIKIGAFGTHLQWLSMPYEYATDDIMTRILEDCPNLHTTILDGSSISNKTVNMFTKHCHEYR